MAVMKDLIDAMFNIVKAFQREVKAFGTKLML